MIQKERIQMKWSDLHSQDFLNQKRREEVGDFRYRYRFRVRVRVKVRVKVRIRVSDALTRNGESRVAILKFGDRINCWGSIT